jgi:hypothetical protein
MKADLHVLPYSGKFSLVQNFAELLATALKEIFVVLIFASSPRGDHTHIYRSAISWFIRSRHPTYLQKTRNFAPCENLPLYTVRPTDRQLTTVCLS